jgi:hypothetical protein
LVQVGRLLGCALGLAILVTACGGEPGAGDQTTVPYAATIDPARFTDMITNRYLPLTPGTTYIYMGTKDGKSQRNEVTVTRETKTILGVRCVVVHDIVLEEGQLAEETFDWYAQDDDGNVWYFGEDSKEYEGGKVASTNGSWQAGVKGAQPGIVMNALPKVGDSYRQEYYRGEAEDMAKVLRVNDTKTVAAGSYREVVVTEDTTPLEPDVVEQKYFAPDVGFIAGIMVKGGSEQLELVEIKAEP